MLRADILQSEYPFLLTGFGVEALQLTFSEAKLLSSSMSLTAASWEAPLSCSRSPSAFSSVAICGIIHKGKQ